LYGGQKAEEQTQQQKERERARERESEKGSCFRVALYLARILWMRDWLSREEEDDDEEEEDENEDRDF
jgi:hypothetical protein